MLRVGILRNVGAKDFRFSCRERIMPFRFHSKGRRTGEVEASISRYKRVIGDTLKSREDARRVTEVAIAIKSLNRTRKLGQANFVRVA
jgi:hypothetical protein